MKILILAQTPPPSHGQSLMQQHLVNARWNWCDKRFIRLSYSKSINEVGIFSFKKIVILFKIIFKVWIEGIKGKIDILYYPPSGNNKIAFYRDVLTLVLIRWRTKKIIFQFHSGGFDNLINRLNTIEKLIAIKIYKHPDAAIVVAENLKSEVSWISPKKIFVIPNGVFDNSNRKTSERNTNLINILSIGILSESKGIFVALDAAKILKEKNYVFNWSFIGSWKSKKDKNKFTIKISEFNLKNFVHISKQVEGDLRWQFYSYSDIFCFPTYYENEAMPLVILEAMMMSLPIISTEWRGIPDIIDDNENGILLPIKDPNKLAEAIERLINNAVLRKKFSINARKKYLSEFTIERHLKRMEEAFKDVAYNN